MLLVYKYSVFCMKKPPVPSGPFWGKVPTAGGIVGRYGKFRQQQPKLGFLFLAAVSTC